MGILGPRRLKSFSPPSHPKEDDAGSRMWDGELAWVGRASERLLAGGG
jgi:hypothetical protein